MTELSNINDGSLVAALTSKKRVITTQISSLKAEIARLTGGLSHLDATIALISGTNIKSSNKTQQKRLFKPSECKTTTLDALRNANSKMDTKSIALEVARLKNIDIASINYSSFQNSILGCLRTLESRKLVKVAGRDGLMLLWEII